MCTICGCSPGDPVTAHQTVHDHAQAHGEGHHPPYDHPPHHHHHHHPHHHEAVAASEPALVTAPPGARLIRIEQDILASNNRLAATNRQRLAARGIAAVNLMSAPGSGKTTLLVRTIEDLGGRCTVAVIEGDQETSVDAERIRAAGAAAIQINTGKGCHLDAGMVGDALNHLAPAPGSVLFIENVGNLVCPAAFDLGETVRVVLLSVTEGDDKPLKYANMFATADLMLVTKIDLLAFVPFDLDRARQAARRVNPRIEIIEVSATRGDGLDGWYDWLVARYAAGSEAAAQ